MVMETTGLIFKYKVDRPLRFEERHGCLKHKERLDVLPTPYLSTVRLNSTYLEMVGKFYEGKGFLTVVMFVITIIPLSFLLAIAFQNLFEPIQYDNDFNGWVLFGVLALIASPGIILAVWTFLRECFRLTHYPIRLNRKLRKLYAIDPYSLKVIEADWDKMVFVLERCLHTPMRITQWEILGHVLDEDGQTVRATLPFSIVSAQQDLLKRHWEYMRRYMEDGVEEIFDHTSVCLPIADHRETFRFGYQVTMIDDSYPVWIYIAGILLIPEALGRYLAMRSSDIPRWSKRIEEECQIDPGDPYAIDARDNPPDFWKATEKRRSELVASGVVLR
jgi:hypothetical protein